MNYISQQEPNQMWIKKVLMLVLADILIVLISYFMALLLRFDFVFSSIPEGYLMGYLWSMPFWIISTIVIFYICRLYHSIWRLASVAELQMILIAYSILAVVYSLGMLFMQMHMPRSYYFIGFLLNFLMTTGLRFSYRLMRFWVNSRNTNADAGGEMHAKDHVMVIGAGAAGQALIKEIINSKKLNTQVVCIIDDNPTKHGRVLEGITIVGDRYSIPEMAKKYKVDRIIYAIPEAAADDRKAILNICKDTGCRLQTVPGVYQLVNGEVSVSRLRNVEITDLLGRAQVQVNMDEIYSSIQGKTLLVTGGGGSIGSELCRQIAASHPKKLIIFDMYENNAYEIQQELRRKYGDSLNLEVLIGSVRNTNRIRSIMQKYKPDVVFHAAAHKHVPLMEDSPNEAIKNNVMGTYKTAVAASRAGVKKFVLISTDKAVNPTNIMGASKRLCEMVVQMMNRQYMHTLLVTSAVAGEGKTTVACNLALGLEKKGYSVLLLDADLRKPAVCRTIQLDSGTEGAYEVLTGQRTAEEVKIRCRDTQLYVIAGTKSLSSTQQILGTGKIAEIIKQLEKEADLVIVDTPPAGILSDAAMLASCVDGGVFVVRQDFADVRILTEGIRELSEAGMEFAGCILNQTEHK